MGAGPTTPEVTILQTAAFADSLLSHIKVISLPSTNVHTLGKLIPLSIFYYRLITVALDCIDNTALSHNKEINNGDSDGDRTHDLRRDRAAR